MKLLQSFLSVWLADVYPKNSITGYYGPLTTRAISEYQRSNNLEITGELDHATRESINTMLLIRTCPQNEEKELPLNIRISKDLGIPLTYTPPLLTIIDATLTRGKIICLTEKAVYAFESLRADALQQGYDIQITSGYRQPEMQQMVLDFWVQLEGEESFDEVALPGHSEHQLGTTIDVTVGSIDFAPVSEKLDKTPEWQWLVDHAEEYGFVMSYPKDKKLETGYEYEPWHWRYFGEKNLPVEI